MTQTNEEDENKRSFFADVLMKELISIMLKTKVIMIDVAQVTRDPK